MCRNTIKVLTNNNNTNNSNSNNNNNNNREWVKNGLFFEIND